MAKELPYFKFEPGAWENGNIQMCSRESKGLFVDLCSIYWSRLGELPYALALQKLCNGSKDALQELIDHEILGVVDGQIVIEFLDEQLTEFSHTSEKRRKAANKRWKDASALQVQSKSNAIREDKIRVDERISAIEVFETKQTAHKEITGNYPDVEKSRSILANRGWSAVTDDDVGTLLFHFLETNDDATTKPKSEVRQHFKNWLNKYDLNELTKLSISIRTRFRQRQSPEVRGNGNGV
jgi:hypothetical protein